MKADVKILEGNTFVVCDDSGDIEASLTDPTGLFSFDTRFLSKWVLTDRRQQAQPPVRRRPAVLRDALLPSPRHRHRLRRRQALGHPPARGRRRLPRGADHPEPRRQAGRSHGADRGRQRLRRPVRGQGRPEEEGRVLPRASTMAAWCSATVARPTSARPGSRRRADCKLDEAGPDASPCTSNRTASGRPTSHVVTAKMGAGLSADRPKYGRNAKRAQPNMARSLDKWLADAPRLECDWDPLKRTYRAQPGRPRRAALLAAGAGRAQPAGRRPAVVHDHVRPRQHLHQPAGAALQRRARRDARCWRWASGRARASTTSATRIPGASCTRCATAS